MEYSYFKSLTSVTKPISLIGFNPSSQLFNKFDKLLLMARVRPCLWVTSKTARPSLPAPTIPTQRTSTSLTTTTVQTIAEVRTSIARGPPPSAQILRSLNIRAEMKSIDNQMAMAENVKWLVTRRVVYKASWEEQLRSYPRSCWASSSAPNTRSRSWISLKTINQISFSESTSMGCMKLMRSSMPSRLWRCCSIYRRYVFHRAPLNSNLLSEAKKINVKKLEDN